MTKTTLDFNLFIEGCYQFGDMLSEQNITCTFGYAERILGKDGSILQHESMQVDCKLDDGADLRFTMDENDKEAWLMVVRNDETGHHRYTDEYHNDINELFESVIQHIQLHYGMFEDEEEKELKYLI
ncbi:hypothetical protein NDK43_03670 [Neobacillus pocheonensis]|uniref:Uncharacterized protein n=1 Tax=Neobacillus pocheonensis TaxID=363869 RepID=A0ABT0W9I8_9BACI|nr:hypothetical protein [Neobacillus pocheonensis]